MKKLLLTLIVAFAFCGSTFAQESHWPIEEEAAYWRQFEMQGAFCAGIMIDGEIIGTTTDGWDALEVAAFVNNGEEIRGHNMYLNDELVLEFDDPYPIIIGAPIYYTTPGDIVTFKMYDHNRNIEYTEFTIINYDGTDHDPILTGEEHWEGYDWYEDNFFLNFTSSGYTLEIDPYTGNKDHYYLIASPVGAIAANEVTGLRTPNFDFYSFAQNAELEWINLRDDEDYELQAGVGYLYANNTGTDLTFNGTPTTEETVTVPLTYAEAIEGLDFPDWNLVGNPFEVNATLDQPFYSMVEGAFVSNAANEELPAMNGAFVVGSDEVNEVIFTRQAGNKAPKLALNLTKSGKLVDRAIVSFGKGRQLPKFQLFTSSKVYIPQNGQDFAVVTSDGIGSMPVNFKAVKAGSYTFTVNSENTQFNYLHLIDHLTGADVDLLATPSYSFDARISDYASRFQLVFATGNSNDDSFACYYNGNIIVSNEGNATLNIVDVLGRTISSQNINGSENVNINAKAGVYTLQLIQGENVKTQKIVVK